LDGTRQWHRIREEIEVNSQELSDYLARRGRQDDDLWIVELDIAQAERFIGITDQTA
jgi:hypothetical protein